MFLDLFLWSTSSSPLLDFVLPTFCHLKTFTPNLARTISVKLWGSEWMKNEAPSQRPDAAHGFSGVGKDFHHVARVSIMSLTKISWDFKQVVPSIVMGNWSDKLGWDGQGGTPHWKAVLSYSLRFPVLGRHFHIFIGRTDNYQLGALRIQPWIVVDRWFSYQHSFGGKKSWYMMLLDWRKKQQFPRRNSPQAWLFTPKIANSHS